MNPIYILMHSIQNSALKDRPWEVKKEEAMRVIRQAAHNRIMQARKENKEASTEPLTLEELATAANQLRDTIDNQTKPDWITDEQWKINPNVYHWEQQKRGAESIARSKPATTQEKLDQLTRLRNEKNWKQGEYQSQKHKEVTEAKKRSIQEWQKSPLSPEELDSLIEDHFQAHNQINPNKKSNQTKPDWITDEQWKINPNVYHWEQQKRGAESQAQLPPATTQEALDQFTRLRNEKSWKQGE